MKGKRVPVVGRITMDMCMIDVTELDIHRGDEVIIFGSDGINEITLQENIPEIGIVSIGILFWSSPRVPKVFIKNGEVVLVDDYLLRL